MIQYSALFVLILDLVLTCKGLSNSQLFHGSDFSSHPLDSAGFGAIRMLIPSSELWSEKYIASKISLRLVKKRWKPKGVEHDDVVKEFPGTVKQAFTILKQDSGYEYIYQNLESSEKLFTMQNEQGEIEFDPNLESIIIIHPLHSSADVTFVKTTITALAMRNLHRKYNIFAFDMPILHWNMLITIIHEIFGQKTQYEPMAETLSSFIVNGVKGGHWHPGKIHMIGYSYSGNLVGYMGRVIQQIYGQQLASLLCLDPYAAQYNTDLIHVSKDDARVVHAYHVSSYISGTRERIGTADFVFNDGFIQPECRGFISFLKRLSQMPKMNPEPFTCSHLKVVPSLWYIILYPSKFKARRCDTWQRFEGCLCENNPDFMMTYPIEHR